MSSPALRGPGLLLALLVGLVVAFEATSPGLLPPATRLYDALVGLTPFELVLGGACVALAGVLAVRHEPLVLPGLLTVPLLLVVLAAVSGAAAGYLGGAGLAAIVPPLRSLAPLVLVPLLVVNVVRDDRALRWALGFAGVLAGFKAVQGLGSVAAGVGDPVEGGVLTYYEPTANALATLVLCVLVAGYLRGVRWPRAAALLLPLVGLALLLSYRRSFWIAAVLGLLLVLVLASGRLGRSLIVPGGLLCAAAVWAALAGGIVPGGAQGPVAQRIASLDPSQVSADQQDRYRLDERANVIAELRRAPVTGLGLGVPWTAREPLGMELEGGRDYTHVAALFWWMKFGVLGLVAYISLYGAAVVAGLRIARHHPDPWVRAGGLGAAAALLGVAVAELTATFTGSDLRFTTAFGALLGLLAVADRAAQARRSVERTSAGTIPPSRITAAP